jgi:ABC-type transport system involved in cytochrome c biogenesis permease subunit
MTWADNINGTYEAIGGMFMIANCIKVYKDKEVKGISLASAAFFCSWGYFNIYYYPSLNQIMSTVGAILMTIANTTWIGMAIYYVRHPELATQVKIDKYDV